VRSARSCGKLVLSAALELASAGLVESIPGIPGIASIGAAGALELPEFPWLLWAIT